MTHQNRPYLIKFDRDLSHWSNGPSLAESGRHFQNGLLKYIDHVIIISYGFQIKRIYEYRLKTILDDVISGRKSNYPSVALKIFG